MTSLPLYPLLVVTELSGVQFLSEIILAGAHRRLLILVISNRTRVEITRMISEQIALHSIKLLLFSFP